MSPLHGFARSDAAATSDAAPASVTKNGTTPLREDATVTLPADLEGALAALPSEEREAVFEHVRDLLAMDPEGRRAVLKQETEA